jgi:osmotically-inducible protein OsmY
MKKLFVGFVMMTALALSTVLAHAQQSVAGEWVMSVQGMSLKLVMAQVGEKISGTLESPHGEIRITGNFSNGKVILSGASPEPHAVHLTGTATVTADGSLAGSMSVELTEMNFTAVRATGK